MLKVERRKDTGTLTIVGTVAGIRIRKRAQSDNVKLAREEAATLEANILRGEWHGERRGSRSFGEAALSYLQALERPAGERARIGRLLKAVSDVQLKAIDQDTVTRITEGMTPATARRGVIVPLRAILRHAAKRGWCDVPLFETPKQPQGRTLFLLPSDADQLIAAASPHLAPLLTFLLGTGARMSEALELEWRDVDLNGARAIFWRTKNGKRRVAALPPRVVMSLRNSLGLSAMDRAAPLFVSSLGRAYSSNDRQFGGQIKTAWAGALKRSGLPAELTPHDLRHTWATWHYAVNRDLLSLKQEGGWSSVTLVERYAHLMPAGSEAAINAFLGYEKVGRKVA